MKKFILTLMVCLCAVVTFGQTAVEKPKLLDNTFIGVNGGVYTPLSFNSVFPVDAAAGIKVGKQITPIFGLNVEGTAIFGSATDNQGRFSYKTAVRATNVGLNATINVVNAKKFTLAPEVGLGWLHAYNSNADDLSAKTGVIAAWNVSPAISLYAEPQVLWNLTANPKVTFDKSNAYLGLQVGAVYHFKNANGKRGFTYYNIGAMNDEINNLRAEPTEVTKEIVKVDTVTKNVGNIVVCFAQNSSELTATAITELAKIPNDCEVSIIGEASPEGTAEYNQKLSEDRANAVANYLKENSTSKIVSIQGLGTTNNASNRIVTIIVQ